MPEKGSAKAAIQQREISIAPPKMEVAIFEIVGTTPYVQHAFSQKAREMMRATQEAGRKSKSKKDREAKDFEAAFLASQHRATDGWCGIPAAGIRAAMIDVCRATGYVMTRAKLGFYILPDGFDAADGQPLVRITKGEPQYHEAAVRLETGVVDIRARAMFQPSWRATVRVQYDADMFSAEDVANLLLRAGLQCGIGEGRPYSKKSAGCGWGLFEFASPVA